MNWEPRSEARHIYVSTYCIHDLHVECRRACKHCSDPCKCDCHLFPILSCVRCGERRKDGPGTLCDRCVSSDPT